MDSKNGTREVQRLVAGVCRRKSLARFLLSFATWSMIWAGIYLVAVLVARLTGLLPDVFEPSTVLAVPGLALVCSLVFYRTTRLETAARLADDHAEKEDLFLTSLRLTSDSGEFTPLVAKQAEDAARTLKPGRIVPWKWEARYGHAIGSILLLFLVGAFTPQLDPFNKREAIARAEARQKKLDESRQATAMQAKALEQRALDKRSEAVERELKRLEKTFKEAKPAMKEHTRKEIAESQKQMGEMWRRMNEEKLRDAMKKKVAKSAQQFGAQSPERKKFREMAEQGKLGDLKKELEKMKEALKDMAQSPDSAERRKQMEELKEKMQAMADALQEKLGAAGLNDALQRAMEQMDMANMEDLTKEAMEAMQETLGLSQEELESLAKAMQDMKNLNEAMSAAQMAKMLNEMGELDGQGLGQCETMSDYEKLYKEMMERLGQGQGEGFGDQAGIGNGGMGGPGQGRGGKAPENPDAETDFKSEVSKSALQKGRLLMSMESKGDAEKGEVEKAYKDAIGVLKEEASEAILKEQIPPGYHESIRDYFDNLEPAE